MKQKKEEDPKEEQPINTTPATRLTGEWDNGSKIPPIEVQAPNLVELEALATEAETLMKETKPLMTESPHYVWVCQECKGLIEGEWTSRNYIQSCQCDPETRIKVKHHLFKLPTLQVGASIKNILQDKIDLVLKYTFKDGQTGQQTLFFEGVLPEDDDLFVQELKDSCPEDVREKLVSIKAEFALRADQTIELPEWWTSVQGKWHFK